jgi:hypothetical protein
MHLLGVSDFLGCITSMSCIFIYFDARFSGLSSREQFPLLKFMFLA